MKSGRVLLSMVINTSSKFGGIHYKIGYMEAVWNKFPFKPDADELKEGKLNWIIFQYQHILKHFISHTLFNGRLKNGTPRKAKRTSSYSVSTSRLECNSDAHLSGRSSGVMVMRRRRILYRGPITFPVTIRKEIFWTGYKSSSNWASSRVEVRRSNLSSLLSNSGNISHALQEESHQLINTFNFWPTHWSILASVTFLPLCRWRITTPHRRYWFHVIVSTM